MRPLGHQQLLQSKKANHVANNTCVFPIHLETTWQNVKWNTCVFFAGDVLVESRRIWPTRDSFARNPNGDIGNAHRLRVHVGNKVGKPRVYLPHVVFKPRVFTGLRSKTFSSSWRLRTSWRYWRSATPVANTWTNTWTRTTAWAFNGSPRCTPVRTSGIELEGSSEHVTNTCQDPNHVFSGLELTREKHVSRSHHVVLLF